jgi:hypothetical protein
LNCIHLGKKGRGETYFNIKAEWRIFFCATSVHEPDVPLQTAGSSDDLTCQFVIMGNFHPAYLIRDKWGEENPDWDLKVEMVAFLRVSEGWRQAMFGIR